jgi:hypothetical protein
VQAEILQAEDEGFDQEQHHRGKYCSRWIGRR